MENKKKEVFVENVDNDNIVVESKVYRFIQDFLENKALNSPHTASNYESDIRQFFITLKNKNIEMLSEKDLIITNADVEKYQVKLSRNNNPNYNDGKPYSASSVSRKISSVKKLYSKLEANNFPVKEAWLKVDKIKGETKSWGVLEWNQVLNMIEIVKKEKKGDIKACLLETAVITCFREKSLLSLTWDNIKKIDGVWVLCAEDEAIGKGKKVSKKSINDDLYERIIQLKSYGSNKIFPIEKKTIIVMMQRLREQLELDEDITFHSLKKCGINEAFILSGKDIMAVAEQGDHASFGTTMKYYMAKKKKFSEMVGLKIGQEVDLSPLYDLTKEELLELIGKTSRSVQIELLLEMLKNN